MTTIFITLFFLILTTIGIANNVVFFYGYIWSDIVTPINLINTSLRSISFSMLFGIAILIALPRAIARGGLVWDRTSTLIFIYGLWMTASLSWAVHQESAWHAWEYAIKAVLFALILPNFLRSKKEIEGLIWVLILCIGVQIAPYGVKFAIGGGGYGQQMGIISDNSKYAESSTLSMIGVSLIPFVWYISQHQTIFKNRNLIKKLSVIGILLLGISVLGTYARTGLICLFALATIVLLFRKRRILNLFILLTMTTLTVWLAPEHWTERMNSINDKTENSSMGRVAVWLWTIEYVKEHPLGGGFGIYRSSSYTLDLEDGRALTVLGKAFHSIYFEVLGSLGYIGFVLYLGWLSNTILCFYKLNRLKNDLPDDKWRADLATSSALALFIFLIGGSFVGVAFQTYPLYLAALSISLNKSLK